MNRGPGRELGVDTQCPEGIQGEHGLGNQQAPVVKWKVRATTAQGGGEVVLKSLDGAFSSIAAMDVNGCELVVCFFLLEVGFEDVRALVFNDKT